MKQSLNNSSSGSSRLPPTTKSQSGAWGVFSGSNVCHASTDATLFSSSLPILPHKKLNTKPTEPVYQSVSDVLPQENEANNLSEDVETHAIGGQLPDDEDELLAGIMDDFDLNGLLGSLDDIEDYDIFGSGSMELGTDSQESPSICISRLSLYDSVVGNDMPQYGLQNVVGTIAGEHPYGEHPYGEHPSRTLFVRNINTNVEDSELKALFEQYGDIRTLYTACKHRGFVMISYYDIRAARTAMRMLQNKPLRRRKLDIHFSIPKDNPSDKDMNQGTLVVFNLDPSVSNEDLRRIFGGYGEVKEIRETPHKKHHKFIEYYDVRAAEAALKSLNRSDLAGKRIKLEPSRPGGSRRNLMLQLNQELEQDEFRYQVGSPITNSPPGIGHWAQFNSPVDHSPLQSFSKSPGLGIMTPPTNNHLPGLASILHPQALNSGNVAATSKDQGNGSHLENIFMNTNRVLGASHQMSHSFTEPKLGQYCGAMPSLSPTSNISGINSLSGPQFLWGSPKPNSEHTNSPSWTTPSVGHSLTSNGNGHGFPYSCQQGSFLGSFHHPHHHYIGSAPSNIPLERHFGFLSESPEASFMNKASFGGMSLERNDGSFMVNMGARGTLNGGIGISGNIRGNGSFRMMSSPRPSPVFLGNGPYPGLSPGSLDGFTDHAQSRWIENNGNQIDSKKQFQLDLDKIISKEDTRTTIMLKNIPNKYTSKMLLAAIDENHNGTYDFFYLPIDFKNKCNMGYAFINLLSPEHIIPFYEAFNGKKWEKFNSEKVASLAYGRIQGKAALVTHFQNSSLMNEDKRCRPILFPSENQVVDDQIIHKNLPSPSLNILVHRQNGSPSGDHPRSLKECSSSQNPDNV